MSNPSPNRPRNLFGNNTNPNIDETITPPTNTGVEPSPIAVPDRENVASIPPTEEILASPQHMDHPFEYLIDAAFAALFQPTKDSTMFPPIPYQWYGAVIRVLTILNAILIMAPACLNILALILVLEPAPITIKKEWIQMIMEVVNGMRRSRGV